MSYLTNDRVIRQADRFAPGNPPKTPCWKCHDQKRVKATEDELKEKLHVWLDRFGVRWGLELINGWQKDHCLPCGECGL